MSKRKNTAVKEMRELPVDEKLPLAIYGLDFNANAARFVSYWDSIFALGREQFRKDNGIDTPKVKEVNELNRQSGIAFFQKKLEQAIASGDGGFFRNVANAIERKHKPVDPVRSFLLQSFMGFKTFMPEGSVYPVQPMDQIHQWVCECVQQIDKDQLRAICKEIGFPIAPTKTGRPKKLRE